MNSLFQNPHRVTNFIRRLPRIGLAFGSLQCPWWSWHFPWPRWSRSLWCQTGRGCRCHSGSIPALQQIPASRQCWRCVNPIKRAGGEIKKSYDRRQRGDGLEHADPMGLVTRSMLRCEYKWLMTYCKEWALFLIWSKLYKYEWKWAVTWLFLYYIRK